MNFIKVVLTFLIFIQGVYSQLERVPLEPIRQPSDDLIYDGELLTAEQAWQLQTNSIDEVDLSLLDPMESEVWHNHVVEELDPNTDNMNIYQGESYEFKGTLLSNQGIIRFNVLDKTENKVYTLLLEKTLHTALLRKNLLRKLGYKIPAMKYIPSLKINFSSVEQRNQFLIKQLPEATYGAPSRWLGKSHKDLKDDELEVEIFDVVAFEPKRSDHYNVAMGVPPKTLTSRTLRSLLVPYALADLGESVNKFSWNVGQIDNENIILPHFSFAHMNASINDVRWAAKRLAKLKRIDFFEIVEKSYFPRPVAKLLVEKLIARRNALLKVIEVEHSEIEFSTQITSGEDLVEGRITKEDWDGYASRFAHGEPESPLKGFQYFLFSKLQNSVIQNLLSQVNQKLSLFEPNETRMEFLNNQFEEGLAHFVETGEFLEFGVGTWFSPILNGNLILSRDIVVGNYLGTDNLVQLADTIGVGVSLGGIMGIENVPAWPVASARASASAVRTYTHLKPVKSLKASFKEPYKNLLVPLIRMKLKKNLARLASESEGVSGDDIEQEKLDRFEELLTHINENLGVGESILITDRISPTALVSGSFNMMNTKVSMSAGTSGVVVRRVHLFRKDASTIQVYEDLGKGWTLTFSTSINKYIPITHLETSRTKGDYRVKMHTVDINTDLEENPNLYQQAHALYYLLEEGSSELLEINDKPYVIETDFTDKSTRFSFLVWRAKYLGGNGEYKVTAPNGQSAHFLGLSKSEQSGINYQAFAYDLINYYMRDLFSESPIVPQLDVNRFRNPGQSIFGVSETKSVKFESRYEDEQTSEPFMSVTSKKEGWSASKSKMKKFIDEINDEYGVDLFSRQSLNDAEGLRLFDINISINMYEGAIENLKSLSSRKIRSIGRDYARSRFGQCSQSRSRRDRIRTASDLIECGNLNNLIEKSEYCQKLVKRNSSSKEVASCLIDLVRTMDRDLEFDDFKELVGEDNIYVSGVINGFRKESEILNEPIRSNSIGRVRSRFSNGPLDQIRNLTGMQGGEFNGLWIRESL